MNYKVINRHVNVCPLAHRSLLAFHNSLWIYDDANFERWCICAEFYSD
jgi:hypothetical protein